MSGQDILAQDEIDALINGVGSGAFGLSRGQQAIKIENLIRRPGHAPALGSKQQGGASAPAFTSSSARAS
jgi:hypothetical protein